MTSVIKYQFPPAAYQVLLLISAFLYVGQAAPNTLGAAIRQAVGGPHSMSTIRRLAISAHVLEALAMLVVNVHRGSSLSVTVRVWDAYLTLAQVGSDDADLWGSVVGHVF